MHLRCRKKKKSRVERGWAEHQDQSGLSSWISIIPFLKKKKKKKKAKHNLQKKKKKTLTNMQAEADTRTRVYVGPAWKALPGPRQEKHQ